MNWKIWKENKESDELRSQVHQKRLEVLNKTSEVMEVCNKTNSNNYSVIKSMNNWINFKKEDNDIKLFEFTIPNDEHEQAYMIYGKRYSEIPLHKHLQREKIYIIFGKIAESLSMQEFGENEIIDIPSLSNHGILFLEDSLIIIK